MSKDLINKIMGPIKAGEVNPKPKYIFVLGGILLFLGTFSLFILSGFFTNTLFYTYSSYRSYFSIPHSFPWPVLLLLLSSFWFGILLFKKFEISYTRNQASLLMLLVSSVILSGYLLHLTPLNKTLTRHQGMQRMYKLALQEEDWIQGTVINIVKNTYMIRDSLGDTYEVIPQANSTRPKREFSIGECMRAVGTLDNTTLNALGLGRCGMGKMNP
jgi:hypothetical protein